MKRRYSHLGPVCVAHGKPLSVVPMRTLYKAHEMGVPWRAIARRCGIAYATLYRIMCGGNGHRETMRRIEDFADWWSNADDASIAELTDRWSTKRRDAHERKWRAA